MIDSRDLRLEHGDDMRLSSLWDYEAYSALWRFNIGIATKTFYANMTANLKRNETKKKQTVWVRIIQFNLFFLGLAIS